MVRNILSAHQYRLFSWMLLIAAGLAATMAVQSNTQYRIHPDEFDHIAAARFYLEHWLPPAVADPRTLDSYSYAGMSYLNEWDIVYLLAGKFALLIRPIVQNEILAFRFFNVFLFVFLTCMAWAKRDYMLALSVLLLSPQIWYVFSYFNADAFPMLLCFLAVHELTSPKSAFNNRTRAIAARYLRLAVYVGLIIVSKKTFWIFAAFTCCYAVFSELWHCRERNFRLSLRRAGIFALTVCAVALPRIGYDHYLNGTPSQKTEKILAAAELYADSDFKPSRIGSSAYSEGINLKQRGMGLWGVVHWKTNGRFYWFKESVLTAFGAYHYLWLRGPAWQYVLSAGVAALLAVTLFVAIILKGNSHDKVILSLSAACCVSAIGLSLYSSWVNDFQPQGRYLFAIFPVLAALLARSRELVSSALITTLVGCGFLLSSYSFLFVGLNHIPKYWENVKIPTHPVYQLEREWKRNR